MSQTINATTSAGIGRRSHRRNYIERLLDRAKYLDESDHALIAQVYQYGSSISGIARVSGQSASNLRRHVARLLKRMNSPLFTFMMAHGDLLPGPTRKIATLVVLKGCSQRRAASLSGQTLHRVRKHLQTLRALARV